MGTDYTAIRHESQRDGPSLHQFVCRDCGGYGGWTPDEAKAQADKAAHRCPENVATSDPPQWGSWWFSPHPHVAEVLTQLRDCLQCHARFTDPWLVPTGAPWPDSTVINAEVAWHWQDTHGFPADMLVDLVNTRLGFRGVPL